MGVVTLEIENPSVGVELSRVIASRLYCAPTHTFRFRELLIVEREEVSVIVEAVEVKLVIF